MPKSNAARALKLIVAIPSYYDLLPRLLKKDNLTYADIGTTKEEVDQLYVAACKAKAQVALDKLLHGCWNDPNFAEYKRLIWGWLRRGDLILADIGATREEVEEVVKELRYLHYYNLDCNYPWRQPTFLSV